MRTRVTVAAEPPPPSEVFHLKYRPSTFDAVLGQDAVVKSLRKALSTSRPHAFLFTGPSGTGKTTLARLIASHVGVSAMGLVEVDAATNRGIDAVRDLTGPLQYQGFGQSPNKLVIIDEAHGLSKDAWQALLKIVEEPPDHVFFVFCTTEVDKIPPAIRTRCLSYDLKPVRRDDILDLLEFVVEEEKLDVPPEHLQRVASACDGSPRQSLVMLQQIMGCQDLDEVDLVLSTPQEATELIELARDLVGRRLTWTKLTATLKSMPPQPAESVRIVLVNYLGACLMGAKNDDAAEELLHMTLPFLTPFNTSDKMAPLLAAFGQVLYGLRR